MKIIHTDKEDIVVLVDDEDYERLNVFKWFAHINKTSLIVRRYETFHPIKLISIANEVMQNFIVMYDHKDRCAVNNQKNNLREATWSQNMLNREKFIGGTSDYKGVSRRANGRWTAQGRLNGKVKYLGVFKTELEAAKAYNMHAILHYGEWANINIL